jgi:hypothetical protein
MYTRFPSSLGIVQDLYSNMGSTFAGVVKQVLPVSTKLRKSDSTGLRWLGRATAFHRCQYCPAYRHGPAVFSTALWNALPAGSGYKRFL